MCRIVHVVNHPFGARALLARQLVDLRDRGFEVTVISSGGADFEVVRQLEQVQCITVPFEREISPLRDVVCLWKLTWILRRLRPSIVHASTPKGGLLGSVAAWLAGVPVRIYLLRGLRLETTRGLKRWILRASERTASACATRVVCVSESLRRLYLQERLAVAEKAVVLAHGSSQGVDARHFSASEESIGAAAELRRRLAIPPAAPVIGFVGRLTRDKGVVELCESFERILQRLPECRLLMVGDFECGDPVPRACVEYLQRHPQVILTGFVCDTALYYRLMDVLVLPSHREGLPNVLLEAAAAEIPTVAYRATGTVDAVRDGVTGTLVPIGELPSLIDAVARYLENPELRREHGRAGRRHVLRYFRSEIVWEAAYREYLRLLAAKGIDAFDGNADVDAVAAGGVEAESVAVDSPREEPSYAMLG